MATTVYGIGKTIASPEKLVLPQDNDAANPSLAFGDGDTGFYEITDDNLQISMAGTAHALINSSWIIRGVSANDPGLIQEAPTATNPNILPDRGGC